MKNNSILIFIASLVIALYCISCKDNTTDPKPQGEDWEARLDFGVYDSTNLSKSLDAIDSMQRGFTSGIIVSFKESYPSVGQVAVIIVDQNKDTLYFNKCNIPDSMRAKRKTVGLTPFKTSRVGTYTGYLVHFTDNSQKLLHTRKLVCYE